MAATLELRLTGGASNTDPDASLGGVSSTTAISSTALNNLFANVSAADRSGGSVKYRALSIYNSGDASATSVTAYMSTITSSTDSDLAFGLDSTTGTIADEDTAPSGVSFANYTSSSKLSISDIASSGAQRIWIRRTTQASATNTSEDLGTIAVDYA